MFVTFDTFCNLWFPLLISLGLYCLGDGEFKDAKAKENAIDLTNVKQIKATLLLFKQKYPKMLHNHTFNFYFQRFSLSGITLIKLRIKRGI